MAGCLPPMLMTVALRFLPPGIKLYGLGAYALTATFGPNLGLPLAAFTSSNTSAGGGCSGRSFRCAWWRWPRCPMACPGPGAPGTLPPVRRHRPAHRFPGDLRPGDRSAARRTPGLVRVAADLPAAGQRQPPAGLFLVNEWSHPLPFFRLQLLKRRNLTFALITLAGVLVVLGASMGVPTEFLAEIRGYRPCRAYPWCCWWLFRSSSRCRWWRPSATSADRLPLGAGLRPVPVRRCLPELQPTDGGLGARGLLPADATTGGRPADGGDSAADASTSVIAPIEGPSPQPGSTPSAASPG